MDLKKVEKYLSDCLEENGWSDCFLVEISINSNKRIQIFLDSDDAVTYQKCRKISRYIEEILDETLEFGADYAIDVSSAGIGKPLKFLRQYHKNVGRSVIILTNEDEKIKGKLISVSEEELVLSKETIKKQGKKKSKSFEEIKLDMNNIKETKIAVSF